MFSVTSDGFSVARRTSARIARTIRHRYQETQANQFAAEVLCPAAVVTKMISGEPDLRDRRTPARCIRDQPGGCRASHGRRARRTAGCHLVTRRTDRYFTKGPGLSVSDLQAEDPPSKGQRLRRVPSPAARRVSATFQKRLPTPGPIRPGIEILEQTRVGKSGHAVTLLWMTNGPDADEEDDELLPELGQGRFR
jgi:hypothetical protein